MPSFWRVGERSMRWHDAIDSAGIVKPARTYDLRSTSIPNALARGLIVSETARIAGTSTRFIEHHYGTLLDTATIRSSNA